MQSKFNKIFPNDDRIFHLHFPESIRERLQGIHCCKWSSKYNAILYRPPCLLHSFGLQDSIFLVQLSESFIAQEKPKILEPNSIAFCAAASGWIAELPAEIATPYGECTPDFDYSNTPRTINRIRTYKMKYPVRYFLYLFLIILSVLFVSLGFANEKSVQVKIQVGESKEVDLKGPPKNLDISHSDVIDVQRVGTSNRILITALRSGTSALVAHFPDGSSRSWAFQVGLTASLPATLATLSSASLMRTARELQRRSGLEVTVDNGRVALFGTAQNEAQMRGILEICLEREECLPRYTVTDAAGRSLLLFLRSHLNSLGINNVMLDFSLSGVIFSGFVTSEDQLKLLERIAQSVCPRASFKIDVEKGSLPLVQSQLSFYRISQTGLSALGVSTSAPATSYPESALTKVSTPNISAKLRGGPVLNFSLPELLLKAHTQRGIIQQIAQPAIVVASGSRGEILSGGELLFQSGGQHQKFFSQNYGISVVLQPRVVSPNKIVQRIELKITHPQSDPTQNAISALSSSVLNTEVSSQVNELLLLTRISQKANGKSTMKIPILGHIPILGELFKSRELSGEDAELWITLKSDLVVPEPPTLESEIRNKETSTEPHWLD